MAERAPPVMSLPSPKDLRERAARVGQRTALRGTPRSRFLREQRQRLVARLLPVLATCALATGAAAISDLFRDPPVSRWLTLAQGLTASALALLALLILVLRRSHAAALTIATLAAVVIAAGWGVVTRIAGGFASPYPLAIALGISVIVFAVPLPEWLVPLVAGIGVAGTVAAAPQAPPAVWVLFACVASGGYVMARTRKRRALVAFRRFERFAAALARMRRMQEQIVVVEKLEALRVLVGGIAHELNNALAISMASADQVIKVADRGDPHAIVKAAQRAQGGLVRIRGTIDRLKRFALAEEQILEPADVSSMLDFALESAIGRARSGVVIDRVYDPNVGQVECHVAALAEALYQVSKNAIESMPKGGTVRASVRRDGARVALSVADEGMGIPPQRLAKVFDPFYAREGPETFTGGRILPPLPGKSGLGLSAVYGLVTAMGGKVEIRSEVGRGTEVSILLPAHRR